MSKQTVRRAAGKSSAKRRPQARKGRAVANAKKAGRRTDRTAWIAAIIIIAVGGALVFAFAGTSNQVNTAIKGDEPAPASLVSAITSIPTSVYSQVGLGNAGPLPTKLDGSLLTAAGKPRIIYLGAEYCPFCATERWAMVAALSQFGTFSNLKITSSAGVPESYPNTSTWSFHGSSYKSQYIQFEPVETETNTHATLDAPTAEQSQFEAKYDAPPYVQGQSGSIPFIDFANQYMIGNATYSPSVLADKKHDAIVTAMRNPTSDISQGAIGSANMIIATICKLTGNKPANACTSNTSIAQIENQLP